jgi:hypothetical protein
MVMIKTMRWQTRDGKHDLRIEIELITEERINNDGHVVTVPRCEIYEWASVDGIDQGWLEMLDLPINGAVARWGKIGLTPERLAEYKSLRAEVEATPEWQAHLVAVERGLAARREYDAHVASMREAMEAMEAMDE